MFENESPFDAAGDIEIMFADWPDDVVPGDVGVALVTSP